MSSLFRQQKIMRLVRRAESVSVAELVELLDASPATVRRDVIQLEEAGKIVRTHGAIMDRRRLSGEPSFSVKRQRIPEVKRRIGAAVAEQIRPGASVFIDAGTTCLEAGLILLQRGGAHNLHEFAALALSRRKRVQCPGRSGRGGPGHQWCLGRCHGIGVAEPPAL